MNTLPSSTATSAGASNAVTKGNSLHCYQVPIPLTETDIFPAPIVQLEIKIPEDFCCSITGLVMQDPVTNSACLSGCGTMMDGLQ